MNTPSTTVRDVIADRLRDEFDDAGIRWEVFRATDGHNSIRERDVHLFADAILAALRQAGQREYGTAGLWVDEPYQITPVAYYQDGRPTSKITHQRLVLPWVPVSSEEGTEG